MENWKDIPGYEGYYQASTLGRIRSVERSVRHSEGVLRVRKSQIRLGSMREGYHVISLSKNQVITGFYVHRLIALTFIPNPDNKPQVNHINSVRDDNRVENLEWATNSENQKHAFKHGFQRGRRNEEDKRSKPVIQKTLNGEFIAEYPSINEAFRIAGGQIGNISRCCRGKSPTANGYKWEFKNLDK